ncbi:hypothetical protein MTBUT4_800004 [Magnetospirillum sp. UT-4]|nr:hypothetical protein MTBUT4_800004 [Magnetospirillum sp. UT-4]
MNVLPNNLCSGAGQGAKSVLGTGHFPPDGGGFRAAQRGIPTARDFRGNSNERRRRAG